MSVKHLLVSLDVVDEPPPGVESRMTDRRVNVLIPFSEDVAAEPLRTFLSLMEDALEDALVVMATKGSDTVTLRDLFPEALA